MNSQITYRPDIDGLRAIAVLAILFYHARFTAFAGGYVGVDVFFVISGFLITSIIIKDINAGEFSIARFYERRIRRIFPALYVILLFVLIATYFLYNPENFTQAIKSVIATVGFVSNILFWTETGYFDAPATLKPLLHTWSLAVEEQFYIFFPLLLVFITRFFRAKLRGILIGLAAVSLLVSLYVINQNPASSFYFPHLRAWELLIGSLLVFIKPSVKPNMVLAHLLSILGLGMILASTFLYTETTLFPGLSALLPTLGSAIIIYSSFHNRSIVGKLLSLPPFVFIGKISYSLYLWHWPIIIFGMYYIIQIPTTTQMWILVTISFFLAALSWHFVENPFRAKGFLTRQRIFIFAGGAMTATLVVSGLLYFTQKTPGHFSQEELETFSNTIPSWNEREGCIESDQTNLKDLNRCMLGDGKVQPSFLVWGDSHAEALAPSIDEAARLNNMTGYVANHASCPPILGIYRKGKTFCVDINNRILTYIEEHPKWETIILVSRWTVSTEGERYKTDPEAVVTLVDTQSSIPEGSNTLIFEAGMQRTIEKLLALHRKVVIVSTVPEVGYNVPSAYFIALRTGRDVNQIIAPTFNEYHQRNATANEVIAKLQSQYNILVIDPSSVLCDQTNCKVVRDGKPMYIDSNHLSYFGASYVSGIFQPIFDK